MRKPALPVEGKIFPLDGELLRELRINAGLTQQQLADLVPIHRVSLARWEAGMRRMSDDDAVRLHAIFQALRRVHRAQRQHWRDFDTWS